MESYPLYLNQKQVGWVDISGDGELEASCEGDGYIYRLYDGGKNLGVMLPKDGRFILKKACQNLSRNFELMRFLPGESIAHPLPFPLSQGDEAHDFSFISDELLLSCLKDAGGCRTAFFDGSHYIYFPFSSGENPMAPFFFALTLFETSEGLFAAFRIKDGEIKTIFSSAP